MTGIAFCSDNSDFIADLRAQIEKYAPEFKSCDNDDEIAPDIAIIDENPQEYHRIRNQLKSIPLIYLYTDKPLTEQNSLNISLKKPFSLMHFFDILRSANNKLDNSKDGYLSFGSYELHPLEKEIKNCISNEVIKLTEREVEIIKYLYKFRDIFISKTELQKNVWKYNEDVSTHTVETHIYRLRRKVESNGSAQLIITDKGGYKLNMETLNA